MSTSLGTGFMRALIDGIAGEPTSPPCTIPGTFRLHVGDPGPDLDENIQPGSERPATFVVDEDLQGYVRVSGELTWVIELPPGAWEPVTFSFVPEGQTVARFGGTLGPQPHQPARVMDRDHLHLDSPVISWSVTSA